MRNFTLYGCILLAITTVACKKMDDIQNNNGGNNLRGAKATCGADSVHNASLAYGSMTDQDGNVYKTIQIGTQTWMAENLKTAHYRYGNPIPVVTDNTTWATLINGATCWYDNDSASYDCPYGRLYNGYAVVDPRNVCPVGWHVPSNLEWEVLIKYLDSTAYNDPLYSYALVSETANHKLKNASSQYWPGGYFPGGGVKKWLQPGDNSAGFSALPGGQRFHYGTFDGLGSYYDFSGGVTSYPAVSNLDWIQLYGQGQVVGSTAGSSVRCIKD